MQVLKIRYYQLKRNLGFLFPALLALCAATSCFFFSNYQHLGYYTAAVIVYLFYSIHGNRTDKDFARRYFVNARWQMALEYQLFLLPLSLPCLFTPYAHCFPLMHAAVLAVPFLRIPSDLRPRLLFLSRFAGSDYVFISGLRRHILALPVSVAAALLLSPVKLFPLVALFMANVILFSFQEKMEPIQMLRASGDDARALLFRQSSLALSKLAMINVPVLTVNVLFNPDMLLFDLYFLTYHLVMMAAVVALKYESYAYPASQRNHQGKLVIMLTGLLNPYMSVTALIVCLVSRKHALDNLKHYLDDRDHGTGIRLS